MSVLKKLHFAVYFLRFGGSDTKKSPPLWKMKIRALIAGAINCIKKAQKGANKCQNLLQKGASYDIIPISIVGGTDMERTALKKLIEW
ncbi:MAG: hypothetical protein IJD82_05965, partial [Clostridia bacterium]|nr:hypothetical protein [Clostridia bacterium]